MKSLILFLAFILISLSLQAQGLQDGGQGSGGDEQAEYSIAVNAQWNIVSVPTLESDLLKISVFPTATSQAMAYDGGYVAKDTLDNGPGYWLKFPASTSLSLTGSLIYTDSIPVEAGWNMVGSISDPIASSSVTALGTTIQSSFFSFTNGFTLASTIEPGLGHWVKTSTSGVLVMSSGNFQRSVPDTLEQVLASLNKLTITDASGGERTLYFGQASEGLAELPPVPPLGIFDARFASHSMIASSNQGILLSSAMYPITVTWEISSAGNFTIDVDGRETRLTTSGTLHLASAPVQLSIRVGESTEMPKEFALSQNYPNPFNPTTSIQYALPVQSRVRLELFSILGQRVATIVNDDLPAGYHTATWNGLGDHGQPLGSGTYLLRLTANGDNSRTFSETRKMLLLK